jgi:hypothetical protein
MTPTLKLRRSFVMEKYKETIDQLFDGNSLNDKKRKTESLISNSNSIDGNS